MWYNIQVLKQPEQHTALPDEILKEVPLDTAGADYPVFPPPPETTYPDPKPIEEAWFAGYVDHVRKNGDFIDNSALGRRTYGLRALSSYAPFMMATEALPAGVVQGVLRTAGGLVLLATAYTKSRGNEGSIGSPTTRLRAEQSAARSALLGDIELFRTKTGANASELTLYYKGPSEYSYPERSSMHARVQAVARMAQKYGIEHLSVDERNLDKLFKDEVTLEPFTNFINRPGFELRPGELPLSKGVTMRPEAWLKLEPITQKRIKLAERQPELTDWLMEALQQAQPDHPLVFKHQDLKDLGDTDFRWKQLQTSARKIISRDYTDTDFGKDGNKLDRHTQRTKERQLWASTAKEGVVWHEQGVQVAQKSAFSLLGLKGKPVDRLADLSEPQLTQLREMLERPDQYSEEVTTIVPFLLQYSPKELRDKKLQPDQKYLRYMQYDRQPEATYNGKSSIGHRLVRAGKLLPFKHSRRPMLTKFVWGALGAGLMITAGAKAGSLINDIYDARLEGAQKALSAEGNTLPLSERKERLYDKAFEGAAWMPVWKFLREDIPDVLDIESPMKLPKIAGPLLPIAAADSERTTSGQDIPIGNSPPETGGVPVAHWNIDSEGLNPAGYWAVGTSAELEWDNTSFVWRRYADDRPSKQLLPTGIDSPKDTIKVTRHLEASDADITNRQLLRIPVLNGTRPIAASIDGREVALLQQDDNTFMLQNPRALGGGEAVEYYLASQPSLLPKATQAPRIQSHSPADISRLKTAWEDRIPGFADASPEGRARLIADYISSNHTYTLQPFDEAPHDFDQYFNETVEDKEGKCDTTATLAALPYDPAPQGEAVVNVADGYYNQTGTDTSTLTGQELHAWNVVGKSKGDKPQAPIDGTPSGPGGQNDNSEKQGSESSDNDYLLYGGGLLALAGLGYAMRRRIAELYQRQTDKNLSNRRLKLYEDNSVQTTMQIVDALRYDPNRDIVKAAKASSVRNLGIASTRTAYERLMADDVDPQALAVQLKERSAQVSSSDKQAQRALRRAQKHLKTAVKIQAR